MSLDSFGARVKFLRRKLGLSQIEVQQAGGPSVTVTCNIEKGHKDSSHVSARVLNGLATALKCNPSWLATGEGNIWPEGVTPPIGWDTFLRAFDSSRERAALPVELVKQICITPDELDAIVSAYLDGRNEDVKSIHYVIEDGKIKGVIATVK